MKRLDYYEVKKYIENFGYRLLSEEYVNAKTKILVQCNNNHDPYYVNFDNFKSGCRCPICSRISQIQKQKYSYNYVKNYIESYGYLLLDDEYINAFTKITIKCPFGHVFEMDFAKFKQGVRCSQCAIIRRTNKRRFSLNYVKEQIESIKGYKLLSTDYKNCEQKLTIQCPEGHTFKMSYDKFRSGQRCPICQQSKGEEKVRLFLKDSNISFQRQYSFDDCRNIEPLRFDFVIFDSFGEILFLCEYDGQYHYLPIEGEKKLKYQQKLDNIKNIYCQTHNIPLLRIPYWEYDNIDQLLQEQLTKHKLIA